MAKYRLRKSNWFTPRTALLLEKYALTEEELVGLHAIFSETDFKVMFGSLLLQWYFFVLRLRHVLFASFSPSVICDPLPTAFLSLFLFLSLAISLDYASISVRVFCLSPFVSYLLPQTLLECCSLSSSSCLPLIMSPIPCVNQTTLTVRQGDSTMDVYSFFSEMGEIETQYGHWILGAVGAGGPIPNITWDQYLEARTVRTRRFPPCHVVERFHSTWALVSS